MKKGRHLPAAAMVAAMLFGAIPAFADGFASAPGQVEQFKYSWRLRGALSWVAGLRFPTQGVGQLTTEGPNGKQQYIDTELKITSTAGEGYYLYRSHIEADGSRTLMTYHGYAFAQKHRNERTLFDYVKRLARIHKETPKKVEDRVKPLPADELRDILTSIYYLRQQGGEMTRPMTTEIYSDGKLYPVVFRPLKPQTFNHGGRSVPAQVFEIVSAPGAPKKWSGGVRVWISKDEQRIPLRIEILRNMASLQLDLVSS
ncbi:MAG: DUF3108 domain-containing protein [Thermoanaerobaculia bacterium]